MAQNIVLFCCIDNSVSSNRSREDGVPDKVVAWIALRNA
jgi:hypothetical protein